MPHPHHGEYTDVNKANWESRVPLHEQGYDLAAFADPDHLSGVVTFDLPRLGDVAGLDAVHLQCHIGTDTVSLARLGAHVTGLDFSPRALEVAERLARTSGVEIEFVESKVYDAVEALGGERFDLVYTGIGALNWLPDVRSWARVVAGLLRPGGRLFIREGHPMLGAMCDPRPDDLLVVEYPYFETDEALEWFDTTSYVPHEGEVASPRTLEWNHGLAEVITAVLDAGMQLTAIEEHMSVPWAAMGTMMEEGPLGEFQLREKPERLAATYTLQARKG